MHLQGLKLAKEINFPKGEAICIDALGNVYFHISDNAKALEMYLDYLKRKQDLKDDTNISVAYYNIASAYTEVDDYPHALTYILKAKQADEKTNDSSAILYDLYSLGSIYSRMEKQDSALYYTTECYRLCIRLDDKNMTGAVLNTFGEIYLSLNNMQEAAKYYNLSIPYTEAVKDYEVLTSNYFGLAKIFKQKNQLNSSIYYARRALSLAREAPFFKQVLEISDFLTGIFVINKQFDSAYHYQQLSIITKDSLFNAEQVKKIQNLKLQEQQRQNTIETAHLEYRNKIKLVIVFFVCAVLLIIAIILWYSYRQKKNANASLREQKQKLKQTLVKLKSAQAQLVQKEKMASLGELIAGIAHEIQNPLNFVNNFSELNKELISELQVEFNEGNSEEVETLSNDIKENLEKTIHHGRRADAIVKGMLQHSGKSTGIKEPAYINALCDKYLRLSYHSFETKNKAFGAEIKTNFDALLSVGNPGAEKINVVRMILEECC